MFGLGTENDYTIMGDWPKMRSTWLLYFGSFKLRVYSRNKYGQEEAKIRPKFHSNPCKETPSIGSQNFVSENPCKTMPLHMVKSCTRMYLRNWKKEMDI